MEGWNGEREVMTHEVTRTSHGGNTARVAGKRDGRGTVTLSFDLDAPPWGAPLYVFEGMTGVILEAVSISLNKFITIPVIIKKLREESSVSTMLKLTVDWEFNILAGPYSYPG